MEGLVFYWIQWCYWIYLTFILNKQNPYRFLLSAYILILMIVANFHFIFAGFDFYAGGLFLLFLSYSFTYKKQKNKFVYFFICSFIVTIAYAAFQLFEIFDPVWVIFNKDWMMGIGICYLAVLLQKGLKDRLLIITSGSMQGEILYAFILRKYDFPYPIGTLAYLDVFTISISLLTAWSFLENASIYFENYYHLNQKGKQKSS